MEGVDVDAVEDFGDFGLDVACGMAEDVTSGRIERRFVEPANPGVKSLGALGLVVGPNQHVATTEIDVVREGHGDTQWGKGFFQRGVSDKDIVDGAFLAAGQGHHFVSRLPNPRSNATRVPAEIAVGVGLGTDDILHGEPAVLKVAVRADMDRFKVVKERASPVPRCFV